MSLRKQSAVLQGRNTFCGASLLLATGVLSHSALAQESLPVIQPTPILSKAAKDSTHRNPRLVQPERPTVATHAGTVAPGWIELEQGGEWDKLGQTRLFTVPSNLKIGLSSRAQLNLLVNLFKFRDRSASLGDLTIGVKYRVIDDDRLLGDFAILPAIKLPTAASPDGPGTGTTDFTLLLVSSRNLGPVALDLNFGQTFRTGDGARVPESSQVWAASFGFPVTGLVGAVVEFFGFPGTSGPQGSDPIAALLAGPTFLLHEWLALDAGIIIPLTGPQAHAAYVGFVWNFGCPVCK